MSEWALLGLHVMEMPWATASDPVPGPQHFLCFSHRAEALLFWCLSPCLALMACGRPIGQTVCELLSRWGVSARKMLWLHITFHLANKPRLYLCSCSGGHTTLSFIYHLLHSKGLWERTRQIHIQYISVYLWCNKSLAVNPAWKKKTKEKGSWDYKIFITFHFFFSFHQNFFFFFLKNWAPEVLWGNQKWFF